MSDPLPDVPDELRPLIGHATAGWKYMHYVAGVTLPTDLYHANRIRRGALIFVNNRPKKKRRR